MALFDRQRKKAGMASRAPVELRPARPPVAAPPKPVEEPARGSDTEAEEVQRQAQEEQNVQEPQAAEAKAIDQSPAADPSTASAALSEYQQEVTPAPPVRHETLPAALEPELRKIIDTAVARVAAIELDAIRQSRALTQRSEEQGREALKYALDRAFQLMNSFELLTGTIAGMVDALRVELDDAVEALRNVQEPESELSRELDARRAAQEPVEEPAAQEPEPAPAAVRPEPEPEPEPEPADRRARSPSRSLSRWSRSPWSPSRSLSLSRPPSRR